MSRTKRIYNTERWKKNAIRHYNAKHASFYRSIYYNGLSTDFSSGEALLNANHAIYAGAYCYHPYKELDARCSCIGCVRRRGERNKKRRLSNRLIEKHCKKKLKNWGYY
jgi:hypothetical protein